MLRPLYILCLVIVSFISSIGFANEPLALEVAATKTQSLKIPYQPLPRINTSLSYFSFRPLVVSTTDHEWECSICREIPSFSNQGLRLQKRAGLPQLVAKWRINQQAKWSDGRPLVNADFQLALQVLQATDQLDNLMAATTHNIDEIKLLENPREFEISYFGVTTDYARLPHFFPLPSHRLNSLWQDCQQKAVCFLNSINDDKIYSNPVYNGPFIPISMSGTTLTLASNPKFGTKTNTPRKINVHEVKALNSKTLRQFDLVSEGVLSAEQASDLLKEIADSPERETWTYQVIESNDLVQATYNLRNPILSTSAIRSVLNELAFPEEGIQRTFAGSERWASEFFISFRPDISLHKKSKSATVQKQLKRLHKLGWELSPNGVYLQKEGKTLNLEIAVADDEPQRIRLAEWIAAHWRDAHISTQIVKIPATSFRTTFLSRAEFRDIALFAWQILPGSIPKGMFHSKEIPSYTNQYRGQNISGLHNSKIDHTLDQLETKLERNNELQLLATTLSAELKLEQPLLPLYFIGVATLAKKSLKQFKAGTLFTPSTAYAESWEW